jgi:hypothetical protein
VEDRVVNQNGTPTTVQVPVNIPEGVNPATTVGAGQEVVSVSSSSVAVNGRRASRGRRASGSGTGYGSGSGSGSGGGVGDGVGQGKGPVKVPSSVAETVEVTSSDSSINMSETAITTTITQQQLSNLPINGRNVSGLLRLSPGVRAESEGTSENTFVIDGRAVAASESLTGRFIAAVQPERPPGAKGGKTSGKVEVEIMTSREGKVMSAKAVSGNEALRAAAEKAAMLSTFAPVFSQGRAVRVSGTIVYDFKDPETSAVLVKAMKAEPFSAEDERAVRIAAKLHFWLYELVARLEQRKAEPSPNEELFVRDGWASIRVVLKSDDPTVVKKLQDAGLHIDSAKGKNVTGRIPVDKVATLADVVEVAFVFPRT